MALFGKAKLEEEALNTDEILEGIPVEDRKTEEEEVKSRWKTRVVPLSRPITFEGKEYRELDLTGLDEMSSAQLFKVARAFPYTLEIAETDPEYCCYVAMEAAGLPLEFVDKLSAGDVTKIKLVVEVFLLGGSEAETA